MGDFVMVVFGVVVLECVVEFGEFIVDLWLCGL